MKICVAQTRPVKGDIQKNIENHQKLIAMAVSAGSGMIIFPELSLTGYEPALAKALATGMSDERFKDFQEMSDTSGITIGVGVPIKQDTGICIGMILFQPFEARRIYLKKYLHPDEEPFFISGRNPSGLTFSKPSIALAICYEISVPEHAENAFKSGAKIYIASVAKSGMGIEKATIALSSIAKKYSMTVLLSNCVGHCDDFESGGKTSVWDNNGILAGQLNDTNEGLLILDTDTEEIIEKTI